MESELAKDEHKIDVLEDEMDDLQVEERWLKKWDSKVGREQADRRAAHAPATLLTHGDGRRQGR